MDERIRAAALEYHRNPKPGKIAVTPTKALTNQADLSLAYSPGVAAACDEIVRDPSTAALYTSRANLVAVITNGTAVLGLGNIGPLAGKPVMEGKGVLFKKFAGIDVFDIEVAENDPDKLVDIIASLEPTFGGINLEDIKAPECFYVEAKLRERMKIPVFHDDQHGTAIIASAAVLNGMRVVGKDIAKVKLVCSGAGAAAIACLDLLVSLGLDPKNVYAVDSKGVIHSGREGLDPSKARYAQATDARTLGDVTVGADIFLGLSTAGVLKPEMVKTMARDPLILAMANPDPEIRPEDAKAVRPDAILGTGRSDYPNQVNNVLCFPFMFRGALDVGATTINEAMKVAAVRAIAELAHAEQSEVVTAAYGTEELSFGPEYLIPKPFDPRLIIKVAPAVAQAAMDSGVATRPIADMDGYAQQLNDFVYSTGLLMRPVFSAAKKKPARVVFCEGEDERVLRAAQTVCDEGLARPILIGRPEVVEKSIARHGLRIRAGEHFELVSPDSDPRYKELWQDYYGLMSRKGCRCRVRQARDAASYHPDRRHAGAPQLRRCHAVRHLRQALAAPALHRDGDRTQARHREFLRHEHAGPAAPHAVHRRHLCQLRPDGRAARRDDPAGCRRSCPFRPGTQGGAAVAFEFRHRGHADGDQDATRTGHPARARPAARGRWRDARRRRAVGRHPAPGVPGFDTEGAGQPADHADAGCGQHRLQSDQDLGR
jgi:malate dehydrogenase (oxaloacetate-decarboxylating)(NADP+)